MSGIDDCRSNIGGRGGDARRKKNNTNINNTIVTDPNISLDHTVSTIHSHPDENHDNDNERHSLSFDIDEDDENDGRGHGWRKEKRRKLYKNNSSESKRSQSKNNRKSKNCKTTKSRDRSKSILHTYPIHQTSATESSKKLVRDLKEIYQTHILPLERKFHLYNYCLPTNAEIQDSEFDAKPMVLLLGQYSTGKTTFIRHLIGRDFPAMHIGPEPTTDRFMALVHGLDGAEEGGSGGEGGDFGEDGQFNESAFQDNDSEDHDNDDDEDDMNSRCTHGSSDDDHNYSSNNNKRKIPTNAWNNDGRNHSTGQILKGNSLTVMPELPFHTLSTFGSGFLGHFVGSVSSAPLLQHVTLIDTPGVLSGEKQRLSRSYDFAAAAKWFADRSDLILLLFDAHKLDISDELKDVIETIRPNNDDKMRCVLNKADAVTREQLVRVYGSLMWSMGKIFKSPEVVRVFTGSYWDEKLVHSDFRSMFESDEWLLINELVNLPKSCAERKVNEVVKRIRIIKVHICIMTYLKKNTPTWFGKKKAMEHMIENLEDVFDAVRVEYKLSVGDFPDVDEFARCLDDVDDFSDLIAADRNTLRRLDDLIAKDIPAIMKGASGLSGPDTPVKKPKQMQKQKRKPVSGVSPRRKQNLGWAMMTTSRDKEDEHHRGDNNEDMKKSPSSSSLASTSSQVEATPSSSKSSSPYTFLMLLTFLGIYVSLYIIVEQNLYRTIPIPVVIVRHFLQVQNLIKMYIFDSIPSGDSLI